MEIEKSGMVFQNYALFPHMTVFNNIAFPLKMREGIRMEINPVLKPARKKGARKQG